MLVFIDESGKPHPKDPTSRPVIVAACLKEAASRYISRQLHNLKRDLAGKEYIELKANKVLNRTTFRRSPVEKELVEAFFDLCRNLPLTIFAIIMERPSRELPPDAEQLPNHFRFLLQRVNLLLQGTDDMAIVLFDNLPERNKLAARFERFLHRSMEGQSLTKITDAPFFVDSATTAGIQIADMAASAIRQYHENELFHGGRVTDPYLSAIKRYYQILCEKTVDLETPEGQPRWGFYVMAERHFYPEGYPAEPEEVSEAPAETLKGEKPKSQL